MRELQSKIKWHIFPGHRVQTHLMQSASSSTSTQSFLLLCLKEKEKSLKKNKKQFQKIAFLRRYTIQPIYGYGCLLVRPWKHTACCTQLDRNGRWSKCVQQLCMTDHRLYSLLRFTIITTVSVMTIISVTCGRLSSSTRLLVSAR